MLKGPRLKTVSYRTLGFPEYGMANASNFTRGFTPASNPERGNDIWATKWAFIYVKRDNAKNCVISYVRVPRVRNGPCKQFHRGFTPASNPQRGNNIGAMKWAFIYVNRAKAKTVSHRTLGFPEYGMANASNFTRGFTPASNPERGNNIWATK